jgi:hypothetical protein
VTFFEILSRFGKGVILGKSAPLADTAFFLPNELPFSPTGSTYLDNLANADYCTWRIEVHLIR